jgi:hypothetical protein
MTIDFIPFSQQIKSPGRLDNYFLSPVFETRLLSHDPSPDISPVFTFIFVLYREKCPG